MPAGVAGVLTAVGIGAETASYIAPVLLGAAAGSGVSALEGGDPLKGALTGGLTGGVLGIAAPAVGGALGLEAGGFGQGLLDVGLGAAAGAGGQAITGGNIGTGAIFGGVTGGVDALSNSFGGAAKSPSAASPSPGGAAGGGAPAATGLNLNPPADLTVGAGAGSGAGAGFGVPGGDAGSALSTGAAAASTPGAISVSDLGAAPGASGPPLSAPTAGAAGIATGQPGAASLGAPGGAAGGPTSSFGKFAANPSLATAGNILGANPGAAVGALGLGYEAITQPKLPSQAGVTGSLKTEADQLSQQGAAFQSYLNNGQLPPGAMEQVKAASASAKATIRSQYAALGLSGSTSEATALAGVDERASAQVFQIADSLLQTGIKESGLSADIYKSILGEVDTNNQQITSAISNFAASIAGGGGKGITLNLPGAQAA